MSPGLSSRIPTPMMVDPWLDLYLPAVLAENRLFDRAVELIDLLPAEQRGNAWAIAARGRLALGRDGAAWHAYECACATGGAEVEGLATFLVGGGAKRAAQRAEQAATRGLAADAWCDAAALAMTAEDMPRALLSVEHALSALPEHREALHWERFLAEPDAVRAWNRAREKPATSRRSRAGADANHLAPRRDVGWVSPRRLAERCYVQGNAAFAEVGTALYRLYDAGRSSFLLATEPDWAAVSKNHELVDAELAIGQVEDLVDEERPAFEAARSVWDQALASSDAARIDDVGQALCALATRAGPLAPIGLEAAERLSTKKGPGAHLFPAYAALFAADADASSAKQRAHSVLASASPGVLPFRMAIAALRKVGDDESVKSYLLARKNDPVLGSTARTLADKTHAPLGNGVVCSPRLTPRGLGGRPGG